MTLATSIYPFSESPSAAHPPPPTVSVVAVPWAAVQGYVGDTVGVSIDVLRMLESMDGIGFIAFTSGRAIPAPPRGVKARKSMPSIDSSMRWTSIETPTVSPTQPWTVAFGTVTHYTGGRGGGVPQRAIRREGGWKSPESSKV